MTPHHTAIAVAAALMCAAAGWAPADGAIALADIKFWVGAAPGPGVAEAALVIDFGFAGAAPGAPSLMWGYRWPSSESRNGQDLLAAVVAADPRLDVTGLEFGFVDTIRYDADLDGTADYLHPGFDPGTGRYSAYNVNNAVVAGTPPLFADAAHVLPPNGNPYAAEAPGAWVASTTGLAGRPLADGSWDGWVYASDPVSGPREPVAAVVPEPAAVLLLIGAPVLWLGRRNRSAAAIPTADATRRPALS